MVVPVQGRVWQYWRTINEKGVQVMKLVEILARELEEWPESYSRIVQTSKELTLPVDDDRIVFDGEQWDYCKASSRIYDAEFELSALATDHATAIVTREMWEAERERLEEEQDAATVRERQGHPTVPVSLEPDWSKAPEGATNWALTGGINGHHVWYKVGYIGYKYQYSDEMTGWKIGKAEKPLATNAIPRPTDPQWTGEGLPPVGAVCEMHHNTWPKNKWEEVVVKYCSDSYSIVARDDREESFRTGGVSFRPIDQRTPRDKWIEAVESLRCCGEDRIHETMLARIFDAGLAKLPEDGE